MYKIIEGFEVSVDEDGTWLHFRSNTGLHCSFCAEAKFPAICAKTITEWGQDRLKEQEDKEMELSDERIRKSRIDRCH